ncbi:Lsr2 family protein [Micromonospora sp. 15K316]|uniref:histone-like nucleoid-structuring protein Lsr2 n=1 Tax=Micromonospora sp. 15K316 TaxID=2530376 RepID=UPI001043C149|nr:Lsr2 family protein [Micromonospora sp. 15K316]TDC27784.1 Lsr2 family protein [Micromonospora sp. 15K316]
MATQTVVLLTDDIDHSTDNVDTHQFAFDGVEYEIDLSGQNAARLREALAPYVAAERRLPKRRTARRPGAGGREGRADDAAVRAFWAGRGRQLNLAPYRSYGPIPSAVRDAYRAAGSTGREKR